MAEAGTTPAAPAAEAQPEAPERPGRLRRLGEGPGRLLVSIYAVVAVGSASRAIYQLIVQYHRAPLAYWLSAVAGIVYLVILLTLSRGGLAVRRFALACCCTELTGVLVVGTLTIVDSSLFGDQTVWSYYGADYIFIPLVLPVTGIWWLLRGATHRVTAPAGEAAAGRDGASAHGV